MAGMLAQESPPDLEVPRRRQPRERPELVDEVRLVVVAGASGELQPVDRPGGIDRQHGRGEAIRAGQPLRRDADDLLEPLCQMGAADTGRHAQVADRHRSRGRRDDAARVADQPQAGDLADPLHQLLLEQRQHLARPGGRRQPISQLLGGGATPDLLHRHRPVAQLDRGHGQERRQPPRLEVHADRPRRCRVAELQRAGERADDDPVGVLGRLEITAGASAKRRSEVDDQQRRRRRWQRQPGVGRRALQVVEVVDQLVQRRSRHSGHVLHAFTASLTEGRAASRRSNRGGGPDLGATSSGPRSGPIRSFSTAATYRGGAATAATDGRRSRVIEVQTARQLLRPLPRAGAFRA